MKFSTSFSVRKTLYVYICVCVSSSVRGNGKKNSIMHLTLYGLLSRAALSIR